MTAKWQLICRKPVSSPVIVFGKPYGVPHYLWNDFVFDISDKNVIFGNFWLNFFKSNFLKFILLIFSENEFETRIVSVTTVHVESTIRVADIELEHVFMLILVSKIICT